MNWPLSEVFPISSTYATVLQALVRSRMTARDAHVSTQPMTTSSLSSGSLPLKCSGKASQLKLQKRFSRFTSTTAL
jgi:hypothetical protein